MQTIDLVKKIVEALEDKKAEDITVLDIGEVSSIADYFIIANGNNANQLTAMEDAVDEAMYTNGVHQKQVEGTGNSTWILMDYQDIIVHLFSKEDRQFYDLDRTVAEILYDTINFLNTKSGAIDPTTQITYNYYAKYRDNREE